MTLTQTRLKEIKVKMTRSGMSCIVNMLDSIMIFPNSDMELMVYSILCDVLRTLKKKLIDGKQTYKVNLRVHEALALRVVLLTGGYPYGSYEENEIRIITSDIARQI